MQTVFYACSPSATMSRPSCCTWQRCLPQPHPLLTASSSTHHATRRCLAFYSWLRSRAVAPQRRSNCPTCRGWWGRWALDDGGGGLLRGNWVQQINKSGGCLSVSISEAIWTLELSCRDTSNAWVVVLLEPSWVNDAWVDDVSRWCGMLRVERIPAMTYSGFLLYSCTR
jgi:hypothetical protein